jgi:hypothetical protein
MPDYASNLLGYSNLRSGWKQFFKAGKRSVCWMVFAFYNDVLRCLFSGWIFEYHSKGDYALVQKVEGRYTETCQRYRYVCSRNEHLRAYLGPGLENYQSEFSVSPGAFVDGIGEWQESDLRLSDGKTVVGNTFIKLSNGQGWLPTRNASTGETQLTKL